MNLLRKLTTVPAILALCAINAYAAKVSQTGNMDERAGQSTQSNNPAVVYVDEAGTATSPDGKSWETAYPSLVEAMQSDLSQKEEIWVVKGTDYPTDASDNSAGFTLPPISAESGGNVSDNGRRVVNRYFIHGHKVRPKDHIVELTYPIVDTNQGLCYNKSEVIECPARSEAFYGQDAQYTGTPPSYTDNVDGTITDNVTGLVWTQDLSGYSMPWAEASSYCESLTVGDTTNWRLPNVKELWSIRDFSAGWPWVDTDYFYLVGDGSQGAQQHSWSSNYYRVDTEEAVKNVAFIVNDWTGHIKALDGNRFVRCVSGDEYGMNDFVDNGDSTITDNATGLMWEQNDSGKAMNWVAALAYAEASTNAGYDDWRLPNVKELQSLADYSGVFPAIDSTMFKVSGITNEAGNADYPYYWSSTSNPYIDPNDAYGYWYAWYIAAGYAVDASGNDTHGAGAVRFDTKSADGAGGPDGERYYNYVRLVRGGNVVETPNGDPTTVNPDRIIAFIEGDTGEIGSGNTLPEGAGGPDFSPGVEYLATIGITVTAENLESITGGPPAPAASEVVANFAAYDAAIVITEAQAQTLLGTLNLL